MVVDTSIIALSNVKKTANEAADICSVYGGSLLQINDVGFIRNKSIEEYANGKSQYSTHAIHNRYVYKENSCRNDKSGKN